MVYSYWPVGFLDLWLRPAKTTRVAKAAWFLVALVVLGSYFYGYRLNPYHPAMADNFRSIARLLTLIVYIVAYAGAGAVNYHEIAPAFVAGTVGIGLFVRLAMHAPEQREGQALHLFAVLMGLHALASAVMAGLGRAGFGAAQALSSRYVTISMLMWIGIAIMAAQAVSERRAGRPVPAAVAMLYFFALTSAAAGTVAVGLRYNHLRPAQEALIQNSSDDELLKRLYPDAAAVRARRATLERMKLSVFR